MCVWGVGGTPRHSVTTGDSLRGWVGGCGVGVAMCPLALPINYGQRGQTRHNITLFWVWVERGRERGRGGAKVR